MDVVLAAGVVIIAVLGTEGDSVVGEVIQPARNRTPAKSTASIAKQVFFIFPSQL